MQIRTFIRNYKGVMGSGALLVFAAIGIFLGIIPAGKRVYELYGQVNETAKSVATLRQKNAILDSLDENDLRQQLLTVVSAIPSDKSIPSIFLTIDQLASNNNVSISDMNINSPGSLATEAAKRQTTEEKVLGTSLLPFTISVSGQLTGMQSFFAKVSSVRRLVKLRNFDVSFAHEVSSPSGNISVKMGLYAFYAPLPALNPQAEQTLPTLTSDEYGVLAQLNGYPWLSQSTNFEMTTNDGNRNPFTH